MIVRSWVSGKALAARYSGRSPTGGRDLDAVVAARIIKTLSDSKPEIRMFRAMTNLRALSIVATSFLVLLPATADDVVWNRFRGPNGSGISDAKTVPIRWTARDYNWRIDLPGSGHSSSVVWERRIFVTCGDSATGQRTLICLDARTGGELWKHEEPSRPYRQHWDNSYATATCTTRRSRARYS